MSTKISSLTLNLSVWESTDHSDPLTSAPRNLVIQVKGQESAATPGTEGTDLTPESAAAVLHEWLKVQMDHPACPIDVYELRSLLDGR